jgi:hydroxymethylglutaryl-CoA lyase
MAMSLALPAAVSVREVGLRDGLQLEKPIDLAGKLRIIEALAATGLRRIEAAAFVSPRAVPSMADAEQVAAELHRWPEVSWSALVASPNGARRALAAGFTEIEYVVSAADGHSLANVGRTTDEAVALLAEISELVHAEDGKVEAIIATAWDCPFDGPTPVGRTVDVAHRAATLGADRLALGDTIGSTTPRRVVDLVEAVRARTGSLDVGVHFHDTRGTGQANVLAAVQCGVTSIDASVGGLGGCPFAPGASGNIATEELVYMLHGSGVRTGIDLPALLRAADVTEQAVGHSLPSSLHRAGGPPRPLGRGALPRR